MKRIAKISFGVLGVVFATALVAGFTIYKGIEKSRSEDPTVWAEDIKDLAAATHARGPLDRAILFTGSSSIRFWTSLEEDMQPLVTIRHGFGGAKLHDIEHFAEALITDFSPRAVVVFAGSNDIHPGSAKAPEVLLATYQRLVARVRREQPVVPIYFIGITPSPLRFSVWDVTQKANRLIRAHAESEPNLHYIETGPLLMDGDDEPNRDNYRFDGLHLSAEGYAIWADVIRPRLLSDLGE